MRVYTPPMTKTRMRTIQLLAITEFYKCMKCKNILNF